MMTQRRLGLRTKRVRRARRAGAPAGATLALQNTGSTEHTFTVDGTAIDEKLDGGAGGR